jgi:conjugal transfer mating pair stabilization protein TraN
MRRFLFFLLLWGEILGENPRSFEEGKVFANIKTTESERCIREGGIAVGNSEKVFREIPCEGKEHGIHILRSKEGARSMEAEIKRRAEAGKRRENNNIYKDVIEMRRHPNREMFRIDENTDPVFIRSENITENPLKALNEAKEVSDDENETVEECEACNNEEYTITVRAEKRYLQKITASRYCPNHGLLTVEVQLEDAPESLFREAVAANEIHRVSEVRNGACIFETYDIRGKQLVLRKTIMQNGNPWINPRCYLMSALMQHVINGPSLARKLLSGTPESIQWGDIQNVNFEVETDKYFLIGDASSQRVLELEEQGLAEAESVLEDVPVAKRWSNKTITDSWGRTVAYRCRHKCENDTCRVLEQRGCYSLGGKKCLKRNSEGRCLRYKQTYKCKDRTVKGKTFLGDKNAFCLDGNCLNADYESDKDMLQALGALSVAKEISNVNKDGASGIRIFDGRERGCKKEIWGAKNCCRTVGWWSSDCGKEAQELKEMRAAGKCVKVGEKCLQKFPLGGGCMRSQEAYCCYDSKFTRVVQEQGRRQIGKNFGTAESPNCRGFAPEELDRMNFESMDFSEVADEIMAKFQPPQIDERYAEGIELEKIRKHMKIPAGSGQYLQENMKHLTKVKAKK